jgi:SAM-dependent methyltransferase
MTSSTSTGLDWGRTATDYATYRQGFPETFYERLSAMGVIRAGLRVVDLGTGTGTLARNLTRKGCDVVGVDISGPMVKQARRLALAAGLGTRYVQARAEASGLASESFDVVSAGTCWHWFDRSAVAKEARRLLRPRGGILIAAMDFAERPKGIGEAVTELFRDFHNLSLEALLKIRNRMTFNWPAWLDDLTAAGFAGFECFGFECDMTYTREAFRGRIRASAGGGAAVAADRRAEFDRRLEATIERLPADPLIVPHRVFAVTGTVL